MLHLKKILPVIIVILSLNNLCSQTTTKPVYVIVHGAWGGGWTFKKADSLLTEQGCKVYRPTLTGLGEKVHLASIQIGLQTHITDIVNTILFEDLHNIILVGHSYGGMIITGVADSIPERISKLVYVDALLPEHGESVLSIFGTVAQSFLKNDNGFVIPAWVKDEQKLPKDVPHPYKTCINTISLKNPLRVKIPGTYILTVDEGNEPSNDTFYSQYERANKKGWKVLQLEADHNPQWSALNEFVALLLEEGK